MKVLIVDDSAVFRAGIGQVLRELPDVTQVLKATNGQDGLTLALQNAVDLIILDMEMPVLNGLDFIKQFRQKNRQARILVFSSHTQRGATLTMDALLSGADDFVSKSDLSQGASAANGSAQDSLQMMRQLLIPKVRQWEKKKDVAAVGAPAPTAPRKALRSGPRAHLPPQAILLASSTGGPEALRILCQGLSPQMRTPILIAQHMPALFTAELAKILNKVCPMEVKEAVHNEVVQPGFVYIAPGDFHMRVLKQPDQSHVLVMDQGPKVNYVRPAADLLFESAAAAYGERAVAVVLTGMGDDGMRGLQTWKGQYNVPVLIQDKESSVVWGMPGAVFKQNLHDEIHPIQQMASAIESYCLSSMRSQMTAKVVGG